MIIEASSDIFGSSWERKYTLLAGLRTVTLTGTTRRETLSMAVLRKVSMSLKTLSAAVSIGLMVSAVLSALMVVGVVAVVVSAAVFASGTSCSSNLDMRKSPQFEPSHMEFHGARRVSPSAGFLFRARRRAAIRLQQPNAVARTSPFRRTDHHAIGRQSLIELVDVNVQDLTVLGPAVRIGGPDDISQFAGRDAGTPLHGVEDPALDRRKEQPVWHDGLAAARADGGFGL
jgi:hypothetical protein